MNAKQFRFEDLLHKTILLNLSGTDGTFYGSWKQPVWQIDLQWPGDDDESREAWEVGIEARSESKLIDSEKDWHWRQISMPFKSDVLSAICSLLNYLEIAASADNDLNNGLSDSIVVGYEKDLDALKRFAQDAGIEAIMRVFRALDDKQKEVDTLKERLRILREEFKKMRD